MRSCFFTDAEGDAGVATSSYASPTYDLSQNKVVQYVRFADNRDEEYGHGTHVVGTAVGKMGGGWPERPVTDVCQSEADKISQCVLSDFYNDCSDYAEYCIDTGYYIDDIIQNYCLNTCQCTRALNGEKEIFRSGGYNASELIADSNGVAHAAKVAFFDLGNEDGELFVPYNVDEILFPAAYGAGARVHT